MTKNGTIVSQMIIGINVVLLIAYCALYFLMHLGGDATQVFEVALLLAGMLFGWGVITLDAGELYKHYSKVADSLPNMDKDNPIPTPSSHSVVNDQQKNDVHSPEIAQPIETSEPIVTSESVVSREDSRPELITRSLLFLLTLVPLGIFLLTSTGSVLGIGVYLGIIITLCVEIMSLYGDIDTLSARYLYQLNRKLRVSDLQIFMGCVLAWTVTISILVLV